MQGMMYWVLAVLSLISCVAASSPPAGGIPPCTLPQVFCFADPCSLTRCPAFPTANCTYCGSCTAQFYVNGEEVTGSCNPPSPVCPPVFGGICIHSCSSDDECPSGQICCSNGCGRVCMQGITPTSSPTACSCPIVDCAPGYTLVTTRVPGECCPRYTCEPLTTQPLTTTTPPTAPPTASPTPDCKLIACDIPICPDNAAPVTMPGHCCPSCPPPSTVPNCAAVLCLFPTCADNMEPFVPDGECCPQCPTATPNVGSCQTRDGRVIADGESFPAPDGCNTCFCNNGFIGCTEIGCIGTTALPPIDCSTVRCAYPTCPNGTTPIMRAGECCPRCPPAICSAPIYSTNSSLFNCFVVTTRWTFDPRRGCRSFAYSPCGQTEEGHNVFADEDTCQHTCGRLVISPTSPPAPVRPVPLHALLCPATNSSGGGVCTETCSSDQSCAEGLKCCPNGCGHTCVQPERIPYYPVPQECPAPQTFDLSSCPQQQTCTDATVCADNQLCCQRGRCGRYCTPSVNSAQPCLSLRTQLMAGGAVPGAYIPACQDDGTFAPTQFHGSTGYSWCVNVQTGYPVTPFSARGVPAQCPMCRQSGISYAVGQSFPSTDGCNTCVCTGTGGIACTRRACPPTCSLPPATGPCRAAVPAFYYDQSSGSCRQFTYGGCGGNANKFLSVKDCLTHCAPSDRCLQPRVTGPCLALFPSYFFNSTSGMCEQFNYGGCGGNDNRFSSGTECLQACSPDTPPNECWAVRCADPECAAGSVVVTDDQHCCPYCRRECGSGELQCSDGQCVRADYVCDGLRDCPNGEDEMNCPDSCEFQCGDGHCIDRSRVCDAILDCADHSDAENCSPELTGVQYLRASDIPQQCPNASNLLSVCGNTCTPEGGQCRDGQLCCDTGCGRTCMSGRPVQPVCRAVAQRSQQAGLIGAFQPSCEGDGSFSELQCHGSTGYCWCVDVETGQPVSNGTRGNQSCGRCYTTTGASMPVGASFSSPDGCNTCKCTKEYGIICTKWPCVTESCSLGNLSIAHEQMYRDECSSCLCVSGSLRCNRTVCQGRQDMDLVKVNMTFNGNHSLITNNKMDLSREIKRLLLSGYAKNLDLNEEQVKEINIFKGSIIVTVTLQSTNNTGANLTILLSQLQQDYMRGSLVIRYNGLVLQPTGTFQTDQQSATSSQTSGLLWWHYLLIGTGGLLLVLSTLTIVIIVVVAAKNKRSSCAAVAKENDYQLSYNKDQSEVLIEKN